MTIIELSGENLFTFEVHFVSDYNTDIYEFRAQTEGQIMDYLLNDCNIIKNRNSNMSNVEVFEWLKKNKKSDMFYFARGRYYYVKEIKKIENIDEIKENKLGTKIKNNICIIS